MKTFLILILFVFSSIGVKGQSADSLLLEFKNLRNGNKEGVISSKCAFGLIADIKLNYSLLSATGKKEATQFLSRPTTDTSVVSPNGKFRVHYNLNSTSSPKYDVNAFLIALDSVYNKEITEIGFPMPPSDNGAGGDNLYDFYIVDLGTCCYGYTTPETDLGNDKFTSFVTLDNDYGNGFYTHGIDAAKVTAAHEFNHGVQIGNYIYRSSDLYYYELTSTSMEEFVFDYVNDYLAYLPEYFRHPEYTITRNSGYDLAIWNIFVRDIYGFAAIVNTWRNMPDYNAVQAIDLIFNEHGSSLKRGFSEFGKWTYFTSYRSKPDKYFKDAAKYPPLTINYWSDDPLYSEQSVTLDPVSNLFLKTIINRDTLVTLITNGDVTGALLSSYRTIDAGYQLFNSSEGIEITNGLSYNITSSNLENLSVLHFINNDLAGASAVLIAQSSVYPQPFKYSIDSYLYFPLPKISFGSAVLKVLSLSGNILYQKEFGVNSGTEFVGWNGLDLSGNKLGTGVYFFETEKNGKIIHGKFVIIN